MLTKEQRAKIVNEAVTWLGTPYVGWGCLKGHGVDCGQLLKGIFLGCGCLQFPEGIDLPRDYSLQLGQHKVTGLYLDHVRRFMREIPESEVLPGDVVVYKLGRDFAHAALIVVWPRYVVHALDRNGVCGAHGTEDACFGGHKPRLLRAEKKFFTLKDEYC